MKNKKKLAWKKPEIKVFCRGKAEEHVLGACKQHGSFFSGGPISFYGCSDLSGYFCQYNNAS